MLAESLDYLAILPEGFYVDTTCGLGGHTRAIAARLTTGRILSLDADAESLERAKALSVEHADRITFRKARFSELDRAVAEWGAPRIHGLISDLGLNRWQLTSQERGFSFLSDAVADMRMDRSTGFTAADLVNQSSEQELCDLIFHLAEERRHARKIAKALVSARPLVTTRQIADVVASVVPRTGKLHPSTRVLQGLRMAVNAEPAELDRLLELGPEVLAPGGRWVVIAFHSLDDRKVKRCFQHLARTGKVKILTKHVVKPTTEETRKNPPSRSAVLRCCERLAG